MSQQQRIRQWITVVVLLLVLIGLGAASGKLAQKYGTSSATATAVAQPNVAPIDYDGQDGKTVLELLQANHKVNTVDSSFGTYVQSIDGVTQQNNTAWLFYVDGQPGTEAADKTITKNGQKIEWRYAAF